MYNTNKYDAIIFDMDGTVLQSEGLFTKAELMLLEDYGIRASSSDLDEFRGVSPNQFYNDLKKRFNIIEDSFVLRKKLIEYIYKIFKKELKYMHGFKDFYNQHINENNLKTALVTNTSSEIVNRVNDYVKINVYFKTIITSSDVIKHKPDPEPYVVAMNRLMVTSNRTLIIEDSTVGIVSALKSGADVIAIRSTLPKQDIQSISPDILSFSGYRSISNYLLQ